MTKSLIFATQSHDPCKGQTAFSWWCWIECGTKHSNRYSNTSCKYPNKRPNYKNYALKVSTKRQPAPYGHCTSDWRDTGTDLRIFENLDFIPTYSQEVDLSNKFSHWKSSPSALHQRMFLWCICSRSKLWKSQSGRQSWCAKAVGWRSHLQLDSWK